MNMVKKIETQVDEPKGPEAVEAETIDDRATRTTAEWEAALEAVRASDLFDPASKAKERTAVLVDTLAGKVVSDAKLSKHLLGHRKTRADFDTAVETLREPLRFKTEAGQELAAAKMVEKAAAAELAKKREDEEAARKAGEAQAKEEADKVAAAAFAASPEGQEKARQEAVADFQERINTADSIAALELIEDDAERKKDLLGEDVVDALKTENNKRRLEVVVEIDRKAREAAKEQARLKKEQEEQKRAVEQLQLFGELEKADEALAATWEIALADDSYWSPDLEWQDRQNILEKIMQETDRMTRTHLAEAAEANKLIPAGKSDALLNIAEELQRQFQRNVFRRFSLNSAQQEQLRTAFDTMHFGAGARLHARQRDAVDAAEVKRLQDVEDQEQLGVKAKGLATMREDLEKEKAELEQRLLEGDFTDQNVWDAHTVHRAALVAITSDERFWGHRDQAEREKLAHECLKKDLSRTELAPELAHDPKLTAAFEALLVPLRETFNEMMHQFDGLNKARHPEQYDLQKEMKKATGAVARDKARLLSDGSGLWKDAVTPAQREETLLYATTKNQAMSGTDAVEHGRRINVKKGSFLAEIRKHLDLVDAINVVQTNVDQHVADKIQLTVVNEALEKTTAEEQRLGAVVENARAASVASAKPETLDARRAVERQKMAAWETAVAAIDRTTVPKNGERPVGDELDQLRSQRSDILQELDKALNIYAETDQRFARLSREKQHQIVRDYFEGGILDEDVRSGSFNQERLEQILEKGRGESSIAEIQHRLTRVEDGISMKEEARRPPVPPPEPPPKRGFRAWLRRIVRGHDLDDDSL